MASFIFVSVAKDRDFVVTSCEILFKFLVIFTIKFILQMASFIFVQNLRVVLEHKLFHNWFVIRPTTLMLQMVSD